MRPGDVPVPAFGPRAYVRFSVDVAEELERLLGADYSPATLADRILGGDVALIQAALSLALHDAEANAVTRANIGEVSGALVDAIFLMHWGRTVAEQAAHEERV